jgi:hypothetical protein
MWAVRYSDLNIMPIYQFRNKETEEVFEINLKISEYDDYMKENPNLERYYTTAPGITSGHKTARQLAGSEWNDLLGRIKKNAGRNNTIKN